ncbi:MAG: hypothetical protein CMH55_03250 [Myxococcales bacterium]|nr:hypothetical protein [Myxococcales bacterium]
MAHSLASPWSRNGAAILMICSLAGCLGPGQPWGTLEATMQASFDPSEGRKDGNGRLKTTANYAVALENVAVSFDAFTVVLAAAGAASFDPGNPPEGYSLCHNGHCHADSGELVDYEVIALEMVGGSGGARVAVALDADPMTLGEEKLNVPIVPCEPSPCEVPKGELAGLELTVGSLTVQGTAYDGLSGGSARLPEEGYYFNVTVPIPQALNSQPQLDGSIGPGEPVGLQLAIDFELPSALFDDIEFGTAPPADAAEWQEVLSAALNDHGALSATLERN